MFSALKQLYLISIFGSIVTGILGTCPSAWGQYEQSCYRYFPQEYEWDDASSYCKDFGGHIVSIDDADKQAYIDNNHQTPTFTWIGLSRSGIVWKWDGGGFYIYLLSYDNWSNDANDDGDCVGVLEGKWDRQTCSHTHPFICEVEEQEFVTPPPAATPTVGACGDNEDQQSSEENDHDSSTRCLSEEVQRILDMISASPITVNASFEMLSDLSAFVSVTTEIRLADLISVSGVASQLMKSGQMVLKSEDIASEDKVTYVQDCLEITSLLLNASNSAKWQMIETSSEKDVLLDLMEASEYLISEVTIQMTDVGPPALNISTENIDITILVQETADAVGVVIPAKEPSAPSINIPGDLLRQADSDKVGVFTMIYHSLREVLQNNLSFSSGMVYLGSDVISMSTFPEIPAPFDEPISMRFAKGQDLIGKELVCGYMDYNNNNSLWRDDGIETVSGDDAVGCNTRHLTNFALLVKVSTFQIADVHMRALKIITEVGCSISFCCLLLTFITLVYFRLTSERVIILLNLVVALATAQLLFLSATSATNNPTLCTAVAIILHYLFLATFFWMLAQGVQLYLKVSSVFAPSNNVVPYYFMLGWAIPAIIVAITASIRHEHYGNDIICWLTTTDGVIYAFVGPVICIIVVNTGVLVFVMKAFMGVRANAKKSEIQKIRSGFRACLILLPLLGLTWIFGIFAFSEDTMVFAYLFAVFNSLQGLFIFILHCVCNDEVKTIFRKKYKSGKVTSRSHSLAWTDSSKSTGTTKTLTTSASALTTNDTLSVSCSNDDKKVGEETTK